MISWQIMIAMSNFLSALRERTWRSLRDAVVEVACAIAGHGPPHGIRRHIPLCALAVARDELRRRRQIQRGDQAAMNSSAMMLLVATWTRQRGIGELSEILWSQECHHLRASRPSRVRDAVRELCRPGTEERPAIEALHQRGAFRHEIDVAYAILARRHRRKSVEEIQGELEAAYARLGRRHEPVYPPS
jgi:hypothetical protein